MNWQEVSTLIWHNGNIIPKEKPICTPDFNSLFSTSLTDYFFTNGTDILFFPETQTRINSLLKIYFIHSKLFADLTGEFFKNETKRLLIRNKCYKTARGYFHLTISPKTGLLNEYILLIPDSQIFGIEKNIRKAIVSNRYYKPLGEIMNLPSIENEFRKIVRTEIEHKKVDDSIILNHDQYIVESYLGNIFLVEPGKIITPTLSSGATSLLLRGILINLLPQIGYEVIEKNEIQIENLFDANEVIIAGETGIYSLKGIEYKRYFDNVRKSLILKILEMVKD
jgi:branched-subunit amino acid aminotransferase/4-amino-4-deoxychorismate lyase